MLRDYQRRAIDQLWEWFEGNTGNPCLVLPTGAGKSHIVAALCKEACQSWPSTKILMLTHVKELIEQNAEKMREHWPNAPLGIYSASLNSKDLDQITFGGIQSLRTKAMQLGHVDLVVIDECHLINNKQQGGYRELISALQSINPNLRVVGLTATPFRLGQGMLTDGDNAIFDDLIEPVTIKELVDRGFLSPLKSKHTYNMIDTSNIHKRGGEFVAGELEEASERILEAAILETIARAEDRKHWLFFCAGVSSAHHAADILEANGISAKALTGKHTKAQREAIIDEFKSGSLQALTNANILTTGFDYPDIDLIAMLRPTMSASLYLQMAGRGMRLKSHTDHCLVLDFAGNVETHGPITDVRPPKAKGEGGGDTPIKVCPKCYEQLFISVMVCPECAYEFPQMPKPLVLSNADIMADTTQSIEVTDWQWSKHTSRTSGKDMVKVRYYGQLSDPVVTEYFTITHMGRAGERAMAAMQNIIAWAEPKGKGPSSPDMDSLATWMNTGKPPSSISFKKNGKFFDVREREWTPF